MGSAMRKLFVCVCVCVCVCEGGVHIRALFRLTRPIYQLKNAMRLILSITYIDKEDNLCDLLTQLCRVDYSTLNLWTGPFPVE